MLRAFLIAVSSTWTGLLGASAFNPDDGFLLRSEPLWTVFGLAAYFGMFMLYGIPIYAGTRFAVRLLRRRCRRGVTSTA
jgi:hypothetical protein